MKKLEENSDSAINWFQNNYIKLNTDKCSYLLGKDKIWEDNEVKLLGITIDNSLKFDTHINNICTKANQKLSILSMMRNILNFEQRMIIFKPFFEFQSKYCPLICMLSSKKANDKIANFMKEH